MQYASVDYTRRVCWHGVECSLSRRGDSYDNAAAAGFLGTLNSDLF